VMPVVVVVVVVVVMVVVVMPVVVVVVVVVALALPRCINVRAVLRIGRRDAARRGMRRTTQHARDRANDLASRRSGVPDTAESGHHEQHDAGHRDGQDWPHGPAFTDGVSIDPVDHLAHELRAGLAAVLSQPFYLAITLSAPHSCLRFRAVRIGTGGAGDFLTADVDRPPGAVGFGR
jgi:hypothetical protein